MKEKIKSIIRDAITAKTCLLYDEKLIGKIERIAAEVRKTLKKGGRVLIFGNGGSAADSQHFATELVARFQKERRALPALALSTDTSLLTALANDYSFEVVFKRQIEALGTPKDIVFAISTSGKARNVVEGVRQAKRMGLKTVALTGKDGGPLARVADLSLIAPGALTPRIQESHIMILHIICEIVEEAFI